MPVSKISIFGVRSRNAGGSRWIGQRSAPSGRSPFSSIGSPMTFQSRPRVASPTGTEIGASVSTHDAAAREAVGRVHGDGADAIVAEMLLHLRDQRARRAVWLGHLDGEGAVDRRQRVGEDGVDDDALDLDDPAGVRGRFSVVGHDSPGAKGRARAEARTGLAVYRSGLVGLSLDATRFWLSWPRHAEGSDMAGLRVASPSRRSSPSSPSGAGSAGTTARRRRPTTRPRSSTRATAWSSRSGGCRRRRRWTSSSSGWTRRRTRSTTPPVISTTSAPPSDLADPHERLVDQLEAARRRHPGNRRPGARPGLRGHPAGSRRVSTSRAGTRSTRSWPSSAGRASRSTPSPVRRPANRASRRRPTPVMRRISPIVLVACALAGVVGPYAEPSRAARATCRRPTSPIGEQGHLSCASAPT